MNDLAIDLTGVSKKYRFFSLDSIDLKVPEGQIMGLIGPNGAGKSTTIRILMGLVHQDSGDVRVFGHCMPAEQVAAKWDIGFASEDMRLYESMTLGWHMQFIAVDISELGRRVRASCCSSVSDCARSRRSKEYRTASA